MPTYKTDWRGAGRTKKHRILFWPDKAFAFGGKTIPALSKVYQWETENFGWTAWQIPGSKKKYLAKE